MSQAPSVELQDVSKWFGNVVAVSEVGFVLRPGVTALLGPNGAGKSTVLRLICGLTAPSRGSVRVLGRDPRQDIEVTRQIGLAAQQETLFDRQTAFQFVRLAAALHGMDKATCDDATRDALGLVELDPDDSRRIATYSKGMRQRVKMAQALVHQPHLLVLDEPLTGLDPRQRMAMIELIGHLGANGCCVIVSSHVLDEVERLGSRILVVAQGRLAAEGDFHAIRNLMDDRPRRFSVRVDKPALLGAALLARELAVGVYRDTPETLVIDTTTPAQLRRGLAPLARELGVDVWEMGPLDEDLESVFRYLVGS